MTVKKYIFSLWESMHFFYCSLKQPCHIVKGRKEHQPDDQCEAAQHHRIEHTLIELAAKQLFQQHDDDAPAIEHRNRQQVEDADV